ncbi:MAG TPA: hypothetical protein VGA78_13605 [Gemmatimonadales bacterium]
MRIPALMTAGALALLPARSDAQVSGTIVIGGGPVGGVVTFGQPVIVRPRGGRVVVVERYAPHPRVIVVERWRKPKHHQRHFARRVVYYDRGAHVFYDRYRPGLIEVAVFFNDGRFYRDYDDVRGYRDRGRYDDRYRHRDGDRDRDRERERDRDRYRDRDWDRDRR